MELAGALGLALSASRAATPLADRASILFLAVLAIELPADLTTVFIYPNDKLIHLRIEALRLARCEYQIDKMRTLSAWFAVSSVGILLGFTQA